MIYTKKIIAEELKKEIEKGYDISRISNWAYDLLYMKIKEKLPEISDVLRCISLMEAGPEFEYTEKELRIIIEMLFNNEKDLIKKLNERKLNE